MSDPKPRKVPPASKITVSPGLIPALVIGSNAEGRLMLDCYREFTGGGSEIGDILGHVACLALDSVQERGEHHARWRNEQERDLLTAIAARFKSHRDAGSALQN